MFRGWAFLVRSGSQKSTINKWLILNSLEDTFLVSCRIMLGSLLLAEDFRQRAVGYVCAVEHSGMQSVTYLLNGGYQQTINSVARNIVK
jgi:hypothetical protein